MAATEPGRRLRRASRRLLVWLLSAWCALRLSRIPRLAHAPRPPHLPRRPEEPGPCLRALTAAAASLPMLAPSLADAALDDEIVTQYSRYQEGDRDLFGVKSLYDPIQVDTLHQSVRGTLFDRVRLGFDFLQDTWSGATPISTAPLPLGGNRPTSPDGVSGATPFINGQLFFDGDLNVLQTDGFGNPTGAIDNQLVHTISSASPETRRQVDLDLGYDWDAFDVHGGGGVSFEDDYTSGFVELGGSWSFDQRLTTLDLDVSYTWSGIDATLDHDALPYIDTSAFDGVIETTASGNRILRDSRQDVGTQLGLVRVLGPKSLVEASVGYRRSWGYLENPYKVVQVAFLDPDQQFLAPPGGFYGDVRALLEQRPDTRNQWTLAARYVQFIDATRGALHLGYRHFRDDWGIAAHTFEASLGQPLGRGWSLEPRLRYYSQSEADFYADYLVSDQAYETIATDPDGNIVSITPYDPALLPPQFSSDHRLAGFGALSGGATLRKAFERGVALELSFEYYSHQAGLELGGGSAGRFADFDSYTISGALRFDLMALSLEDGIRGDRVAHPGGHAPAGLVAAHMLDEAGAFMVGYRFVWGHRSGAMLRGSRSASDAELVANACLPNACGTAPEEMDMTMQMLEIMYAPTAWLNLMLMPQFVDMSMDLRQLQGGVVDDHSAHTRHSTGGPGDTRLYVLARLFGAPGHEAGRHGLHAGLGLGMPTGQVDLQFRRDHQEDRGYLHYGMQTGSGTWDLLPSLTYQGRLRRWSWGAQLGGVVRLQDENEAGFAFGDGAQASLWGGYALTPWLSASLRGAWAWEDEIQGSFEGLQSLTTPPDYAGNYGGHFWDAGFGLRVVIPGGIFRGHSLAVEWLQPLATDWSGYQLERVGELTASWSLEF